MSYFSSSVYAESGKIRYEVSKSHSKKTHCLHVKVKTVIPETGMLSFYVPEWVESYDVHRGKEGNTALSQDKRILTVTDKPLQKIELMYDYCPINIAGDLRQSLINKEYIFFEFASALSLPANIQNWNIPWNIEVDLKSFPGYFNFYSSYPVKKKTIKITDTLPNFSRSVIWATRHTSDPIMINDKKVDFVYIGQGEKNKKKLRNATKKLIFEQRKFWQDDDFEKYTAVFLEDESKQNRGNVVGRSSWKLFSCLIERASEDPSGVVHSISHELFHAWLGGKIAFAPGSNDLTWFTEGFTHYYGQRLAEQAGLLSKKEAEKILNSQIIAYSVLPIKNEDDSVFLSSENKDPMYYVISLLRGYFVASKLDRLKDEKGQPLMPIILREILAKAQRQEVGFLASRKIIMDAFSKHLPEAEMDSVNKIVFKGETIDFSPDFAMGNTLNLKEVNVPDVGFNFHELIVNQTLGGLESDSPAFKAGLRNGMKVLDHNIRLVEVNHKIEMMIATDQGVKKFEYFPNSKKINVLQIL